PHQRRKLSWSQQLPGGGPVVLDQSQEAAEAAPDRDAIVGHIQLYIDGCNQCDTSKFRECFHDDAWIFFTEADGDSTSGPIQECFDEWAGPDETHDYEHRILSVTQAGDVASVVLEMHSASKPEDAWAIFMPSCGSTASGRTPTRPRPTLVGLA